MSLIRERQGCVHAVMYDAQGLRTISYHKEEKAMGNDTRKAVVVFAALVLFLGAMAVYGTGTKESDIAKSDGRQDTIVLGTKMILRTLDPIKTICWEDSSLCANIYDSLVVYNPSDPTQPLPSLAERWEVSKDGKEWTFYIRKGVKFTTGKTLTARDVVLSFQRGMKANYPMYTPYSNYMDPDTGFEIVDDYTVKMRLKVGYAGWIHLLTKSSGAIIDVDELAKHISSDDPEGSLYLNDHSIGTGPFVLKEWVRDERITLEKNENYWGIKAGSHRVPQYRYFVDQNVPDINTQKMMLEKGDIDFAILLPKDVIAEYDAKPNPEIIVVKYPWYEATSLLMNPNHGPFADPKVRQAVKYAIDYNTLTSKVFSAIRMDRPIFKGMVGWDENYLYGYNVEKAKQLLSESKYPDGFGFTLCIGTGVGLGADWETAGLKIKQDLSAIGINVKIEQYDWSVMDEKLFNGNYEALENWYGTMFPETEGMMTMIGRSDSTHLKANAYKNKQFDELADAAMRETDPQKRHELYRQLGGFHRDDGPVVYIAQGIAAGALRADIIGWNKNPDGYNMDFAVMYRRK